MQLLIIILLVVSLVLALISLTTNYWYQSLSNEFSEGLWVVCRRLTSPSYPISNTEICHKQVYFKSQGLAVSGFVLLSMAIIFSTIRRYRENDRHLAYLTIVILTGATLLLMFSYLLYPREINLKQLGYSIYFMIASSLLCLITTGLIAFSARNIRST